MKKIMRFFGYISTTDILLESLQLGMDMAKKANKNFNDKKEVTGKDKLDYIIEIKKSNAIIQFAETFYFK